MKDEDGNKPKRKGKEAPPSKDVNDRAPTQGDKDDAGHLTGPAVLDRLYRIRDASLKAWEEAVKENDTKAVVAQSTSFERVAGAIKQQENINSNRGESSATVPVLYQDVPDKVLAKMDEHAAAVREAIRRLDSGTS